MHAAAQRFKALRLTERLDYVRATGDYMGSREHGGHRVHLYRIGENSSEAFFCEVWMRLGLQYVEWIEVASNMDILTEYVTVDVKSLLH